jgi:hypothetical protein
MNRPGPHITTVPLSDHDIGQHAGITLAKRSRLEDRSYNFERGCFDVLVRNGFTLKQSHPYNLQGIQEQRHCHRRVSEG